MEATSLKGKVQTVTGLISPTQLGKTLVHEHLSVNYEKAFSQPLERDVSKSTMPIGMANIYWLRNNLYSHRLNLRLNDADAGDAIMKEMVQYKATGGGSVVDCTIQGIERNVRFLRQVSDKTGVNVIAGTGYYTAVFQNPSLLDLSVEQLADVMRSEIVDGCIDAPDIRCGIIGEVGCSWPLHGFERKVLNAAAHVQTEVKCPVSIHPGMNKESPTEVLRVFQEAGGDGRKVAVCHLDRTIFKDEDLMEFAQMGSYLEFDLFGGDSGYFRLRTGTVVAMPTSDFQRIESILRLIEQGYENKIVVAHDIHSKNRLVKYGGHGYCHIFDNIVPFLSHRGVSDAVLDKILIGNPASWLTFG